MSDVNVSMDGNIQKYDPTVIDDLKKGSIKLKCPCGEPLSLFKHEGKWYIGHIEKTCSPFVSHEDANKVLEALFSLIKEDKFVTPHFRSTLSKEVPK